MKNISNKLKDTVYILFGTKENLLLKLNLSFFISGFIFFVPSIFYSHITATHPIFNVSAIFLFLWMVTLKNPNTLQEFLLEISRLFIFFLFGLLSLYYWLLVISDISKSDMLFSILSATGIFACIFYLISKAYDVLKLVRVIFTDFKTKIFNSSAVPTSKMKSFFENATVLLLSIVSFTVALKTIGETVLQILSYFIPF